MKELTLNKVNKQHKDSKLQNSPNPGRKVTHNATNLANRGVVRDQPKSSTPQNSIKEELSSSVTPVIKDSPKVKSDSNKEAVKSKLLLQSTTLTDTKIQSNNANAKNGDVKPSTLTARGGDNANDKQLEQKSTKDKLNVPLTPSHVQNTGKKENVTPSAPGTPRKEKSKLSSLKSSREASPTRTPPTQKVESKIKSSSNSKQESNTKSEKGLEPVKGRDASPTRNLPTKKVETKIKSSSNSKLESNIKTEKGPETVKGQDISPTRTPPFQKVETQVKSLSNSKQESNTKTEKQMDPVTARDIKVEATEINIKTEEEEAKETGDIILNELGEKPKSILSRVALKKIAARVSKSGQNGDLKHVSVNDTLNNSKNSGKFALSVPMSGKKDQGNDKEDNLSMGSRRDSTKYSIDSMSRKSVDIRMQNQVNLVNKQNEEKPKSLLTNTDSMIRSAIPHLPMGVAVLCLIMNILIPGSGTMLSGFAILCCGKPRVHSKDDHVIVTLCVNVWVGVAQLFTITFLLVGWFWSFAWGIRMVILAVEYRKEQQQQREKQLQTMALSAFGSASHMRSLF